MNRKNFMQHTALASAGLIITDGLFAREKKKAVYGHNHMRYHMDNTWGNLNPVTHPVNDCHEMVQDKKGRILLLTNETKNNVLMYNTSGRLLEYWGHEFPGAHGLTITSENGTEFLFITDTVKHQVYKTTMVGAILMTIDCPMETGLYQKKDQFVPTETTVAENGDFFIADGYGLQYILHYSADGKLLSYFGGKGTEAKNLDNAHGICIDKRHGAPSLLITDRTRHCFKRFDMDGNLLEVISLPGACVCRPVIKNEHLYAAVLRSPDLDTPGSGFVTILDKDNKVVSNLGGTEPVYKDDVLQPMSQAEKIFLNPHDVCVDNDDNIYVAQWASGKVYPYKFRRI
jgi:peptidylamidoglycolate lyase